MNPFKWRLEHQVAFILIALLGAMLGLVAGLHRFSGNGYLLAFSTMWDAVQNNTNDMAPFGREAIFEIPAFGAMIAGLLFYALMLTRLPLKR